MVYLFAPNRMICASIVHKNERRSLSCVDRKDFSLGTLDHLILFLTLLLFGKLRFNFLWSPKLSFTNARTVTSYFATPSLSAHIFGPKWPCPTLRGTSFVDGAFIFSEKRAGIIEIFKIPNSSGLLTVLGGEGSGLKAKIFGKSSSVFQR